MILKGGLSSTSSYNNNQKRFKSRFSISNGVTGRKHHVITNAPKRPKSKFSLSQQVDGWMLSKITEKIIRENAFEQKKKKPGLN